MVERAIAPIWGHLEGILFFGGGFEEGLERPRESAEASSQSR